jgi:hypothetical protein
MSTVSSRPGNPARRTPLTYHGVLADLALQVQAIEMELLQRRCRSLKDCMFRMHAQWETLRTCRANLLKQVQNTRLVGADTGQVDIAPIRTALIGMIAESVQMLIRISEVPEVMTRTQAIAHRDRH